MADVSIRASATAAVPRDYTIPGAQEILPKSVAASMDGTGAGSAWFPCLQVLDPGGNIMFSSISSSSVAAGASADVSWFPGITSQVSGSSVLPIQPAFSGNTIVPTSVIVGVRAPQPQVASFFAANTHLGFRAIITKTGVLHDLAVYMGTNAGGQIEVGILSTDTPTRQILYKTGFVNVTANHDWQIIGDPALQVTLGDQYDFSFAASNAQTVLWIGGLVNSGSTDAASGTLPPNFVPAPLGAPPKLTWTDPVSPAPYGATTTVAEASLGQQVGVPIIVGRIV